MKRPLNILFVHLLVISIMSGCTTDASDTPSFPSTDVVAGLGSAFHYTLTFRDSNSVLVSQSSGKMVLTSKTEVYEGRTDAWRFVADDTASLFVALDANGDFWRYMERTAVEGENYGLNFPGAWMRYPIANGEKTKYLLWDSVNVINGRRLRQWAVVEITSLGPSSVNDRR